MILSDKSIKAKIKSGEIVLDPFSEEFLQPASYDLHIGSKILYFRDDQTIIDVKAPVKDLMNEFVMEDGGSYTIKPGEFILANIKEITGVDNKHVGRLEGKSSLGRLGLIIHATAGFLDPGNCLRMTLEICNLSPLPIKIYEGMKIAQMAFESLDQECEKPYGHNTLNSKYFGDMDVKASQMFRNYSSNVQEKSE